MTDAPDIRPSILRVKRKLQLSLIEFSLEILWDGHQLGKLWTGLSTSYVVPAGEGNFQLGLYRRFWGKRVFTEPLRLTAAPDDQNIIVFSADNHTLSVLTGHYKAYKEGFYYDERFGMPTMNFEVNDAKPIRLGWTS